MSTNLLKLFKGSLVYSLSGLAGRFIGVFLVPVYTRIFSPDQYGVIDLISTFIVFLNILLILGLDSAVGRYYVDTENKGDKKLTASTTLYSILAFSIVVVLLLILFSNKISILLFDTPVYSTILTVALASVPFSILFASFQNLLKWNYQPGLFAITSVGCLLIQASFVIYFVVFLKLGILGIYVGSLVTFIIFSGVGFWLTRSSYTLNFSSRRLKELLYFGVPLIPLSLAHYIMTYSDRYFLNHFSGLHEVGLYGIGYKLASLISILLLGFQHAWGPFVYSTYKNKNAKQVFSKTFDYVSIAICLGILALSLFSKEILLFFTTQEYIEAYKVVPLIMASIATYTLGGYFSVGIGIAKKNIHRAWSGGVAALTNLVLNYLLIPPLGMIGAATATIISFLVLGGILTLISQRYYYIEYKFGVNFIMYFLTALIILIAYKFLPSGLTFESISLKCCLLLVFIVVPFSLRLVGEKELRYVGNIFVKVREPI